MSWISGIVGILSPDGSRADVPNSRGSRQPLVLRLPLGSNPTSRDLGNGTTEVTFELGDATAVPEYATLAAFRSATPPADGTLLRIISPPGEFRYSATSGAGFADDARTILKPDSILLASNGRAFSTRAGATVPTFDALRGLRGSNQDHVHVQAHTTFGDGGGGIFDRAAIGSYVDDGGTIATAGSNAWVRRDAGNAVGAAHIKWWGADAKGVTAADDAFDAAYNYIRTGTEQKTIDFGDGHYRFTRKHTINTLNVHLRGNGRSSVIDCVDIGDALFETTVWNIGLSITGLHIMGGASPGTHIINVEGAGASLLRSTIDITVDGAWTSWLHVNGPSATTGGAVQWSHIRIRNETENSARRPQYGVYCEAGYFNSCWLEIHGRWVVNDLIHVTAQPDYVWGGWCEIRGSAQDCGRAINLSGVARFRFVEWYAELNTNADILDNCQDIDFPKASTGDIHLVGSRLIDLTGLIALDMSIDASTVDPIGIGWHAHNVDRANMSGTFHGSTFTQLPGGAGGGWGRLDAPNILLNGDCHRLNGDTANQIWGASGGIYSAVRCGAGETDTVRTRNSPHCFRIGVDPGFPAIPWLVQWAITPALDSSFLGVPVVVSFKARDWSGSVPAAAISPIGTLGESNKSYRGGVACENSFTHFVIARYIDAALVANGIQLVLSGATTETTYISEVQCSIGYHASRVFARCAESPFYPGVILDERGSLYWREDAEPTGSTNEPIYGTDPLDGDVVIINEPEVLTQTTTGWDYVRERFSLVSGTWTPRITFTSVEVP